jgi:hypothetical protein
MQKIIDANKWIWPGCAVVMCIVIISVVQVKGATTGNLSWSAASPVESAVPAASEPKIAVDPHGTIMAVWVQADSVTTHVYANRYVQGSGWGTAALLEASDLPADNPQIAADSNGNFIAVWIHAWKVSNGTRYGVHANRYVTGAGWGAASVVFVDVTKDYITADADLHIATDPKGDAMVTWSVYDWSWNHTSVRACHYTAGTGWDVAVNLSTEVVRMAYGGNVAMDGDGNAIAVWSQDSGTSISPGVMAVRYAAGTGWGTPVRIESAATAAIRSGSGVQIAFDGQGNALAVWTQYSAPGIFSNRYVAGAGWGAPVATADTGATTYDENVSLAIDKNGNGMAVWNQYGGVLYANRYVAGAGWGTTGVIEANGTDYSAHVAFDQNGNAVAVWGNFACNSYNIPAIKYAVGTGWGYPARCYEAAPSFVNKNPDNTSDPQLVIDKNGIATAVWVQAGRIYSAIADASVAVRQSMEKPTTDAEEFSLHRAAVRYTLARNGKVTISVFNLSGERLFTLTDKFLSAGSYVAALPLQKLGKGQYLVRCKVDDVVVVKKLVVTD